MKKMSKSTLDFIAENIKTNAQASSYPLRKQPNLKITPPKLTSSKTTSPSNIASAESLSTLKITRNIEC